MKASCFAENLFLLFGLVFLPTLCRAGEPTAPMLLSNGLRVVARERPASPLVAIDLWVRAGAREERSQEEGSAHFLEHVLFKGTTLRGPGETDIAIENLGATLSAATGPDFAHFYTTVASVHLSEALAILADIARNATLPDAEVERERGVILDELAQNRSDASAQLVDLLYANAFVTHPYRRPPGGTPSAIRVRGRDTLAAFYRRAYTPARCTLALTGDLTRERARAEAQKAFGDWKPAAEEASLPRPTTLEADEKSGNAPRRIQAAGPTTQARLGIAFRAPPASEATMACAAMVAAALLGESEGQGRLAMAALSGTEATARVTPRLDRSLFILTASLPASSAEVSERLSSLENSLLSVVQRLRTAPPRQEEFNAAKRRVLGRARFDTETNAGLARALGYADCTGGDSPEVWRVRVQRLTLADLQQFMQTYLDTARRCVVWMLPSDAKQE